MCIHKWRNILSGEAKVIDCFITKQGSHTENNTCCNFFQKMDLNFTISMNDEMDEIKYFLYHFDAFNGGLFSKSLQNSKKS